MVIDSVHRTLDNEKENRGISQSGWLDQVRYIAYLVVFCPVLHVKCCRMLHIWHIICCYMFSKKSLYNVPLIWWITMLLKQCNIESLSRPSPKMQSRKKLPAHFKKVIINTVTRVPWPLLRWWTHPCWAPKDMVRACSWRIPRSGGLVQQLEPPILGDLCYTDEKVFSIGVSHRNKKKT